MTIHKTEERVIRITGCHDCDPYKNLGTYCGKDKEISIHYHVFHKTLPDNCPLEKVEKESDMEYKIKTDMFEDGKILQEVKREHEGVEETILRQVFDATDKQAQEALVKLGWLRPEDKERIRRVLLRQIGDARECPNCRYYFIPKDRTCEEAFDIYNEIFRKENIVENDIKEQCGRFRQEIKIVGDHVKGLMKHGEFDDMTKQTYEGQHGEMKANIMLAYRHLEDARMRVGKILQAANDGVSILDKGEGT